MNIFSLRWPTVSKKLESDERSQRRLLKKIEVYLDYIESSDYYNEYGLPSVEATRILLRLTHVCDPEIHELVKRCEAWTKENRAQLVTTYGE